MMWWHRTDTPAEAIGTEPAFRRPRSVAALSVFFAFGVMMSSLSFIALLFPGGFLEPIWSINPRAREQFAVMGGWALVLMALVSAACALTSYGLWNGRRFGLILGRVMLAFSLVGDIANAVFGSEPRAWVGVPIAAALLVLLATDSVKAFFEGGMRSKV
jgi:hypothetical protein